MLEITSFGSMPVMETAPAPVVETPQVNENQFLDFETNKVQVLTLEQLMRTNRENRGDDRSCPHGIYHYALINQILDMAKENGYDAEVYDLFATNNRDKQTPGVSLYPELEDKYGERAVEAHTLRRVYANIRLKNFDTDELTTNIALTYTQKGIQVGFGRNVKVCHNQSMLGTGRFVSDYSCGNFRFAHGDNYKTDLHGILKTVGSWLTNAEHMVVEDDAVIERMKETVFTAQQLYTILGLLLVTRVTHDTSIKEIKQAGNNIYPLNQSQISTFTENLLKTQKKDGLVTAWSFYNCATDLYKPGPTETNNILSQNLSFMDFMTANQLF